MNIYIERLIKDYDRRVLDIENLKIEKGKITAILGLNGSGKTTLLECIANIRTPTCGKIYYDGSDDFNKVKDNVAIMQQKPYIFNMSAKENIVLGLRFKGCESSVIEERLKRYVSYFDINFLNKNAKRLSVGELAKVALLRVVILERDLLLLDEPTANMDIESTLNAERLVLDMKKRGTTVILVTHDLYQAQRITDTVVFMDKGRVIEINKGDEFFKNPRNELVKKLYEGAI
jgi:tungstate transport system ATP-binding protein